uniref:Uncharacterized protein n=1 Tax=Timema poppense TaxID=170557 RepID=A0A7R9DTX6_TIMPO|nr:unnamed protein product [Timema poppensis]
MADRMEQDQRGLAQPLRERGRGYKATDSTCQQQQMLETQPPTYGAIISLALVQLIFCTDLNQSRLYRQQQCGFISGLGTTQVHYLSSDQGRVHIIGAWFYSGSLPLIRPRAGSYQGLVLLRFITSASDQGRVHYLSIGPRAGSYQGLVLLRFITSASDQGRVHIIGAWFYSGSLPQHQTKGGFISGLGSTQTSPTSPREVLNQAL